MSNVVNLDDYRKGRQATHHKIALPREVNVVYGMQLNPYKFGSILIATDKGVL